MRQQRTCCETMQVCWDVIVCALFHACWQYLTAEENALGVDCKGEIPLFFCGVLSRAVPDDAGIVDSNVQATQLRHNSFNHSA